MALLGFLRNLLRPKAPPFVYADWIAGAEGELAIKQDALTDGYGLGTWPIWNAELGQGSLTFSDDDGIQVFAEVQIAGSLGPRNWVWAWGNPHLPQAFTTDSAAAKALGDRYNVAELRERIVAGPDLEALAWRLTAAAVKLAEGLGAYRAPAGRASVYLIIKSITRSRSAA
jgi:hypothetical protein